MILSLRLKELQEPRPAGLPCNTSSATRFRAADHLTVGTPTHGLLLTRHGPPCSSAVSPLTPIADLISNVTGRTSLMTAQLREVATMNSHHAGADLSARKSRDYRQQAVLHDEPDPPPAGDSAATSLPSHGCGRAAESTYQTFRDHRSAVWTTALFSKPRYVIPRRRTALFTLCATGGNISAQPGGAVVPTSGRPGGQMSDRTRCR